MSWMRMIVKKDRKEKNQGHEIWCVVIPWQLSKQIRHVSWRQYTQPLAFLRNQR